MPFAVGALMAKTFKDQKNYPRYKKAKQQPLSRKYRLSRLGENRDLDFQGVLDEGGAQCPYCGSGLEPEHGFLRCDECGRSDDGRSFRLKGAA